MLLRRTTTRQRSGLDGQRPPLQVTGHFLCREAVALVSPPRSLGKDVEGEGKETEIRRKEFYSPGAYPSVEMDLDPTHNFAAPPGNPGRGGAIHQSAIHVADVDRAGRRHVRERAKAPNPLPLAPVAG